MSEYPASVQSALKWIRDHGDDCAVARVNGGGRIYLAEGETGPFLPSTARKMIDLGLAEYVDMNGKKAVRFRLLTTAYALLYLLDKEDTPNDPS